jgi:hypothetical protein
VADRSVTFDIYARDKASAAFDSAGKGADGLGSQLGGLGKAAGIAAGAFAADKLLDFGGELLNLGTQVETYRKKAATVFEDQIGSVKAWADQNNESMGLTDDKLIGLAAGFGDLLKPMGFTASEAADMSTKVVGLSGALSAWSGGQVSAAGASEILAKAMLGERDGLKSLGISISEADVSARLAAKGQQDLTGAALEQAKAVATQELIFEKSTDAQKAWADGSFDAQKQQNELKARMDEVKETLAGALLPAFQETVNFLLTTAIPAFTSLVDAIGDHLPIIAAVAAVITAVFLPLLAKMAIEAAISAATQVASWAAANAAAIASGVIHSAQIAVMVAQWIFLGVQSLLHAAKVAAAWLISMGPIAIIIAAVAGLVALIIIHWDTIKDVIAAGWEFVKSVTVAVWDAIKGLLSGAIDFITTLFLNFTGPGLIIQHWNTISEKTSEIWNGIRDFVSGALDTIVELVTGMPGRISEAAAGMWDGIKDAFRSAINWVIRGWNALEFSIPGFDPPGPGPSFGGFTLGVPNIPELALGGITTSDLLAHLHPNEAVIPLDRLDSMLGGHAGFSIENFFNNTPEDVDSLGRRLAFSASAGRF